MPTTIFTEGWAQAGERFGAMLRQQLLALANTGNLDLSACLALEDTPVTASAQERTVVYRFREGGTRPDAGRRAVDFRLTGLGMAGEGGSPDPDVRIVVPSHWSRDGVVASGGRADRVTVVTPGIDGAAFAPLSRVDREAVRASLGLADDETALLHVGDGGDETGIDLALRAFARLRSAGARVRLVLASDDATVDYDRIVQSIGADEPALIDAGCLAAVATISGNLGPVGWRQLYGAVDALVAPDRGCAFPFQVLEALACGRPVVTTRGGAADDICDDDLAWRISGAIRCDAEGRRCLAPDLDELTDALAEIARGRGFDRLRFASARMRLMRRATWARSARQLAGVLDDASAAVADEPPRPAVLHGMAQPTADRFAAAPPQGLAASRLRATRRVTCPGPEHVSVVVQGPCLREAIEPGAPSIDEAVASIRRSLPGAQVIVSTWIGSDVDGLDADDIVLNPDPGAVQHPMHKTNNVNRVLTSTANGLAAATRPYCIKTRNDVVFSSDRLITMPLHRAGAELSLERRIWSPVARLVTSLRPYHPCDMVHYGLTNDLRRLWSSSSFTWNDLYFPDPYGHIERLAAEQAMFLGYLRGVGIDPHLEMTFDGRREIVAGSIRHMLGAFDVFEPFRVGVVLTPRFRNNPVRPRLYDTSETFEALRAAFARDPEAACAAEYDAFHRTLRAITQRGEQNGTVNHETVGS